MESVLVNTFHGIAFGIGAAFGLCSAVVMVGFISSKDKTITKEHLDSIRKIQEEMGRALWSIHAVLIHRYGDPQSKTNIAYPDDGKQVKRVTH